MKVIYHITKFDKSRTSGRCCVGSVVPEKKVESPLFARMAELVSVGGLFAAC
jgi:hypothetical protein